MADFEFDWRGDGAIAHVRAEAVKALHRAAIVVKARAKELLSVAGTGRDGTTAGRSKPGEPPRKQTGRLRASVAQEVDESTLTARVGTNVPYGKHLELGTRRGLAPRPWLRRALADVAGRLNQILGGP